MSWDLKYLKPLLKIVTTSKFESPACPGVLPLELSRLNLVDTALPPSTPEPALQQAMSLDKFTLQFTPSPDDPNVIDLVDPSGVVHYRERRVQGATYEIHVCGRAAIHTRCFRSPLNSTDPISGSTLISGTAPNPASRHKTLELFNPSITVVLKNIGKVSFRWAFKWEEYAFLLAWPIPS